MAAAPPIREVIILVGGPHEGIARHLGGLQREQRVGGVMTCHVAAAPTTASREVALSLDVVANRMMAELSIDDRREFWVFFQRRFSPN